MMTKDEEFSQVDCHLESNTISKIARGQYMDLEKLIPRQQGKIKNDEGKMELTDKDGTRMSFLMPKND